MDEFVWWNDLVTYRQIINAKLQYQQPLRRCVTPSATATQLTVLSKHQYYLNQHRYRRLVIRYQTHRKFQQFGTRFNIDWYKLYTLLFRYTNTQCIVPTETNQKIFGHG